METKQCIVCTQELTLEYFYFRKDSQKYETTCKKCRNKKAWARKTAGQVKSRTVFDFKCDKCQEEKTDSDFYLKDKTIQRYDTTCKECRKTKAKDWHVENREQSLINKKQWHNQNREQIVENMRKNYRKRVEQNPVKEYEDRKKWRLENKDKINELFRTKYATDENFRNAQLIRDICRESIKNGCDCIYLSCSSQFARKWLESQFRDDMTWENYGCLWQIDHFVPVSFFDLSKTDSQLECFHWKNIQPLYVKDNKQKGKTLPTDFEKRKHFKKVEQFLNSLNKEEKSDLPIAKGSVIG